MFEEENIGFEAKCQQYISKGIIESHDGATMVMVWESRRETGEEKCPQCKGAVNIDGLTNKHLRDMPIYPGVKFEHCFCCHRYRCLECKRKYTEDIPFQEPGTRITRRAARWIESLLKSKISIRSIQQFSRIHWEVIRNIQTRIMEETLSKRQKEMKEQGYKPRILAVDEFAIHKGHTYATCVMDLETGEVLWVGKGRAKDDFVHFFFEVDSALLTDVMAVAMDMNASYHLLFEQYLPNASIVYDRYHMQAQYGKDVLGAVRLAEARKHKELANTFHDAIRDSSNDGKRLLKEKLKQEKRNYHEMKGLRWTLLTNGDNLNEQHAEKLKAILQNHSDLAVCYAMKEEMIRLFELRDLISLEQGWRNWFQAAKESGIQPLVHFAELKEKRLPGLVSHAVFPISTGKLEGFNNKIKVAKRVGYGYRDDDFFFLLVKFLSLPASSFQPRFP